MGELNKVLTLNNLDRVKRILLTKNLDEVSKGVGSNLREILFRRLEGRHLKVDECYLLKNVKFEDLPMLLMVAFLIKIKKKGKKLSFSKKVFIPLTNLCRNCCKYCGFRRTPWNGGRFLKPREVLEIAKLGEKCNCHEALFTLGEKPEEKYVEAKKQLALMGYRSTIEYLRDMCELVLSKTKLFPHSNLGVLERDELKILREVNVSMGLMLENVSLRLCKKGGPHEFSPGKNPKLRLKVLEEAGKLKIAFTTGILLGIGESWKEVIDSLLILRDIYRRFEHIQEVIVQPFVAKTGTPMEGYPQPSILDLVKAIAISRMILDDEVNIQTQPNLPEKQALTILPFCGINDWGGVSPVTLDYVNPEKPWPKICELKNLSFGCGFILKERLPIYPEYVTKKLKFIPDNIRDKVLSVVNKEGYVREDLS
ncbi:MAG: 7,8-didemethyl-8-hydroxy-5-deazariboflavin synthase CofG [Candidatus Bathyarchaeota archaeon]|nr:7,8-didemethyl-8-hydroxy-5-deazariboflavin synthase CofG [Candidatus Bathyarchaeota archaeon]